jgi:hypothetical protein
VWFHREHGCESSAVCRDDNDSHGCDDYDDSAQAEADDHDEGDASADDGYDSAAAHVATDDALRPSAVASASQLPEWLVRE